MFLNILKSAQEIWTNVMTLFMKKRFAEQSEFQPTYCSTSQALRFMILVAHNFLCVRFIVRSVFLLEGENI